MNHVTIKHLRATSKIAAVPTPMLTSANQVAKRRWDTRPTRFGVWILAVLIASGAMAGSPTISSIQPPGLNRGETADVQLTGTGIIDAHDVQTDHPGITAMSVVAKDNRSAIVQFRVDKDVPTGLYPFWLVTKTGLSNIRFLGVGQFPCVEETEPNDTPSNAVPIELDVTIHGVVDREDVDWYKIRLAESQRLCVEVEAIRLHYTLLNRDILDPVIALFDPDGNQVAASDDSMLWQQDGHIEFVASRAGDYKISIRDSAFQGNKSAVYRMHVGDFPRPIAIVPPVGPAGQSLSATAWSISGQRQDVSIDLPETCPGGVFEFRDQNDRWSATSPNSIRVTEFPIVQESEPNNQFDQANDMPVPGCGWGRVDGTGDHDVDHFAFDCQKGKTYDVRIDARATLRSPIDAVLNIFGPDKKPIRGADDVAGKIDPSIQFKAAQDGRHYARIRDHLNRGSRLHLYWIEITPSVPATVLTPKELRRDHAYHVAVPRRGHGVMVVSATRENHNDPVQPLVESLPAGVSAQTFEMPKGRREIPIVFSAAADAPFDVGQITVTDSLARQRTRFEQINKIVLGQNRRSLLSTLLPYSHVVTTEANPFEIEVVAPKSPIVRNGSKDLVMRIRRGEGGDGKPFQSIVSLRTSYNPPGLGINNGKRFLKDVDEIRIPMTANKSAAIGKWPLVFIARFDNPGWGGACEVATPPVMIDIEDSWFDLSFAGRSTGEIGSTTTITVNVDAKHQRSEPVTLELAGLPKGVTSTNGKQTIDRDTKAVTFELSIDKDAKPGLNKNLICIATVSVDDDPVVQTLSGGQLRIDRPLVVQKNAVGEPADSADPDIGKTDPEPTTSRQSQSGDPEGASK